MFGHPLTDKGSGSAQGPPGVGFKLTNTSDYDLDYKRLYCVLAPIHPTDVVNLDPLNKTIDRFKTQYNTILEGKFQEKSVRCLNAVLADIKADQFLSIREEYSKYLKNQLDSHLRKVINEKLNGIELPFTDNNLSKIIDEKLNGFAEHHLQSRMLENTLIPHSQRFEQKKCFRRLPASPSKSTTHRECPNEGLSLKSCTSQLDAIIRDANSS